MYLSILEYVLVRLGIGAVRLAFRALELVAFVALWMLGAVLRIVLWPLALELARTLGRLRGYSRVAARDRTRCAVMRPYHVTALVAESTRPSSRAYSDRSV